MKLYTGQLAVALLVGGLAANCADAQIISVNFSENSGNQAFVGGENIGPLLTDSANWNNTNGQPDLAAGVINDLIDSSGATTTADLTWGSANAWYTGDGTADDAHRQSVGYLDDGGDGISVTIADIPYTNYRVYGLYSSDQGAGTAIAQDMNVNGTWVFGGAAPVSVPAYASITETEAATGSFWSLLAPGQQGNYWTSDVSGASTLTITQSPVDDEGRAGLSGVIIRDLDAVIFDAVLRLTIDRDTGDTTLLNNTGAAVDLAGLGLLSAVEGWNSAAWNSITSNYDEGGTVSNDEWLELARSSGDLSESTLGSGTLADGQAVNLGSGLWTQFPSESGITVEYLDANTSETVQGIVEFIDSDPSNGESTFAAGDYNFDGSIDLADWPTQRDNYRADLSALSTPAGYQMGDFNLDGVNDLSDQLAFKAAFLAANPGATAASLVGSSVPEPATVCLLLMGGVLVAARRFTFKAAPVAAVAMLLAIAVGSTAQAQIGVNFRGGQTEPATIGPDVTGTAGVVPQGNWNNVGGNDAAVDHDATVTNLVTASGTNSGASVTWSTDETWTSTANGPAGDAGGNQDRNLMDGYIDAVASQPTATVDFNSIPYAAYDVYVYVGSDGNERTGNARLNGDLASTRWFETFTAVDSFNTAADYYEGTFTSEGDAVAQADIDGHGYNYVVFRDIIGSDAQVGVTRGTNNVGVHGVQIVENLDPQVLTLEINTSNGQAAIKNSVGKDFSIDFFEVSSNSSSLDESGWSPLDGGVNDGMDWDVLGNASDGNLAQLWLGGNGQAAAVDVNQGGSLALGSAYQGTTQDLVFTYNDTTLGVRRGLVSYVDGPSILFGDADNDGAVAGSDLLAVTNNFGSTGPADGLLLGDADDDGAVAGSDLLAVTNNFGSTLGSGSLEAATVPEPSSIAIVGAACAGLIFCTRKRNKGAAMQRSNFKPFVEISSATKILGLLIAGVMVSSVAQAAVTNDRLFLFGDPGSADATFGANVGEGNAIGFVFSGSTVTGDDAGPSGAFLDLEVVGPTYTSVASRPGASAGDFGASFGGDDYLTGVPLNRPDVLAGPTPIGNGPLFPSYPLNYDGITARGLQMWVYPEASALGNGRQGIVQDTIVAGGVSITADGKWTQTNSSHGGADVGESNFDVVGDTWHHVMHHISPATGADQFKSVVYVNGIAVSANLDGLSAGTAEAPTAPFGSVLVVGAEDTDRSDPHVATYDNFFNGTVDDLAMYVYGTNDVGTNYGVFNLFADNEWIASELSANHPGVSGTPTPGDLDLDGDVDDDDVADFVAGWRSEKRFQAAHSTVTAGDFETWGWGDSNLDGQVNFSDWALLRNNHPNGSSLNLADLLVGNANVPEPSALCLALIGGIGFWATARARRSA